MIEDLSHSTDLTPDELDLWAATFGLTFPVLADEDYLVWEPYNDGATPTVLIIDRDLTIVHKAHGAAGANDDLLISVIDGLL